jgi:protein involved in temperature-dependent protein secretion
VLASMTKKALITKYIQLRSKPNSAFLKKALLVIRIILIDILRANNQHHLSASFHSAEGAWHLLYMNLIVCKPKNS